MQTVDHFAPRTDVVAMSCVQFFTGAVLGAALTPALPGEVELLSAESFMKCLPSIAYCGILSSGVAYTFQNLAQASTPPALAAILLSMESVFAAFAGRIFLGEIMTVRQVIGCALVFAAVVFAQVCDIIWPRRD
jgi:drug/metabolite transporter (DMT)-like permease